MIEKLQITNFALIKNLELDFTSGFNVLLGETGAGKSIIISAINFLLGGKADKTQIRSGEEQTKVVGMFSVSNKTLTKLNKFGIEDNNIVISRLFAVSGKNEVKINGEISSLSTLKEIGDIFLDSYNQNDQVELKKTKNHLFILDSYKPNLLADLKNQLSGKIEQINDIDSKMQKYGGDEKSRARRIDILTFEINEIEEAKIYDGEFEEISNTLKRISSSEKVMNCLNLINEVLSSDNSLISGLNTAKHQLNSLNVDGKLLDIASRIDAASIELEDIAESLNDVYDEYNFDENKVNELILRREKLDGLRHKYGSTFEEINSFLENAKVELEEIVNAEEILKDLQTAREKLRHEIYNICDEISNIRRKLALELENSMQIGLKEVGIKNSKFKIWFNEKPALEQFESFNALGFDDVEFMFSANVGEELKPLAKTISGGEMSRFMLVMKNILANNEGTETIIFDEIDTGISGEIADKVANKIESLSKTYQIICITHLPQVAAKGDNFIKVFKVVNGLRTETQAEILNEEQVINQIAFMASGSNSASAVEYAKSLRN